MDFGKVGRQSKGRCRRRGQLRRTVLHWSFWALSVCAVLPACEYSSSSTPALISVQPSTVVDGEETVIRLTGRNWVAFRSLQLDSSEQVVLQRDWSVFLGELRLSGEQVQWLNSTTLTATVPGDVTPGDYIVSVESPRGERSTLGEPLKVVAASSLMQPSAFTSTEPVSNSRDAGFGAKLEDPSIGQVPMDQDAGSIAPTPSGSEESVDAGTGTVDSVDAGRSEDPGGSIGSGTSDPVDAGAGKRVDAGQQPDSGAQVPGETGSEGAGEILDPPLTCDASCNSCGAGDCCRESCNAQGCPSCEAGCACDLSCTAGDLCQTDCQPGTSCWLDSASTAGSTLSCVGAACAFSCSADVSCAMSCEAGANCELDSRNTGGSLLQCVGSSCKQTCTSETSCNMTCEAGSNCEVSCSELGECGLACDEGSSCLLSCLQTATCDLQCDSPIDCGSGVFVCNRACP